MINRLDVDPFVLLAAFRYALGRRTAAVEKVAADLRTHAERLPLAWREQVIREIDTAIAEHRAGDLPEVYDWERTAAQLREVTP